MKVNTKLPRKVLLLLYNGGERPRVLGASHPQ
jgi:hypothetical protein